MKDKNTQILAEMEIDELNKIIYNENKDFNKFEIKRAKDEKERLIDLIEGLV